jgi:hypothetical protein
MTFEVRINEKDCIVISARHRQFALIDPGEPTIAQDRSSSRQRSIRPVEGEL